MIKIKKLEGKVVLQFFYNHCFGNIVMVPLMPCRGILKEVNDFLNYVYWVDGNVTLIRELINAKVN